MPAPRCRPFTILDGMALVAATAVGLWIGLSRVTPIGFSGISADSDAWPSFQPMDFSDGLFPWNTYRVLHRRCYEIANESLPLMFPWTIALFGLRLRQPRPARRRLMHQSGFAATAAVAMLATMAFLGSLSSSLERMTWDDDFSFSLGGVLKSYDNQYLTPDQSILFGAGVVAVWALLALGRSIRRERGWLDWSGRVLGYYWIVLLLLQVST